MSNGVLWVLWLVVVAGLAAVAAIPSLFGPSSTTYTDAGLDVMQFVLALLCTTAGVGSLAVRESVLRGIWRGEYGGDDRDARERLGRALLGAWILCLLIGVLGSILAWASARPWRAAPYLLAATALLAFHAPRPGLLKGGIARKA